MKLFVYFLKMCVRRIWRMERLINTSCCLYDRSTDFWILCILIYWVIFMSQPLSFCRMCVIEYHLLLGACHIAMHVIITMWFISLTISDITPAKFYIGMTCHNAENLNFEKNLARWIISLKYCFKKDHFPPSVLRDDIFNKLLFIYLFIWINNLRGEFHSTNIFFSRWN